MKITIKEIAERAGVSKATVSRVLNNSKPVNPDIRARVMSVIEETNFKPNTVARSLSLKRTHLIGIILPDLSNPVFSRMISGMEASLRDKEYSLLITATDFDVEMKIHHIGLMKEKGVDGLVLVTDHGNQAIYDALLAFEKPAVMIGSDSVVEGVPVVKINNHLAAFEAGQHLVHLNHKRIAMIRGPLTDPDSGYERFEGFKEAVEQHGIYDESLVVEGWYTFDEGYRCMASLLSLSNPPTAVFCACDLMAVGAIKCAVTHGKRVPEDISIVGFDDVDIARMYSPSISTIRQPFEEKGMLAITRLIDMIEKNPCDTTEEYVLPHKFIARESTARREGESY